MNSYPYMLQVEIARQMTAQNLMEKEKQKHVIVDASNVARSSTLEV